MSNLPNYKIVSSNQIPPTIIPIPTHINRSEIRNKVLEYANQYKIRLTPAEFENTVDLYINKYMKNVNVQAILDIAENMKGR